MSIVLNTPRGLGTSKANVEKFAEDIAAHVKFLPGDSIEDLIESAGGKLVVGSSGSGDAESGSIVAHAVDDFTIYVSRHTSLKRDRFTIAHELGHLLLHLDPIKKLDPNAGMRATRWVDQADPSQKRAEWEANWFAAGFLMPSEHFIVDYKAMGLAGVAAKYGVSATAAEIRAKSLGLNT